MSHFSFVIEALNFFFFLTQVMNLLRSAYSLDYLRCIEDKLSVRSTRKKILTIS